ncbi:MAG TPA: TonB-dependent receptor [Pedomonas sp.]|uniref:TonB-dependent receptor n=1 Tax=Pedomonas sp. TaxID=2976421 RepID=UPI002F3F5C2C
MGYIQGTCCALVALIVGSNVPVAAQQTDTTLEEIIVTAQKRAESLQDTPISIAAITARDLENSGIKDLTDLGSEVPNLQVTPHPNSATTAKIFLRGVGNNDDQVTQDPSVAVYLDGVYVARSQGLAMEVAELERIEVLRGPQGSLYGRNATGGAINFITRAPELGKLEGEQKLSFGNYDQFRSRTRLNIPIGDTLAVELAYLRTEKDGYVQNRGTGVDRFGDQRRDAYRAALRWQPSDVLEVRYSYDRSDVNDTPGYIAHVPFYPLKAERPTEGSPAVADLRRNDVSAQGHNLTLSWEAAESLTIKSITGYRKLSNETNQNYHTGVFGPFPIFITAFDSDQKQFTQELQVVHDALDRQLEYVLGVYYFDESADSFDTTSVPRRPRSERTVTVDNKAYAAYAQATYTPAWLDERLHLTLGTRWSRDERKATLQDAVVPAGGAPILGLPGAGDKSFENFSPSAIVRYDLSDATNVYAKVVTGYKTGGYNVRATSVERFNQGFDEENLISYELGLKSTLLEDRLRLNAALFWTSYDDIQINVQSDPNDVSRTDVLNAGKATIKGLELDITARPTRGLSLSLSYAYLDAGYDRILDGSGRDVTDQYHYVNAPKNTIKAGLEYQFPQTAIGSPAFFLDYYFQDKKLSSSTNGNYIVGDYGLLDARITLTDIPVAAGDWSLALYGRNLTDKEYYADHFNAGAPSAYFGEPRTYGIEMAVRF